MLNNITVFDSTLRDGAQGEGITFSIEDKMKIFSVLDDFGIDYIEAGNPSSNPKDEEFFRRARLLNLNMKKLVAFGSTRRKETSAEDDLNLHKLVQCGAENITVFGKSWDFHVDCILNTTLEENLSMIYDTIKFLADNGKKVFFDAEHFFDGYKNNKAYALKTLETAEKAGASCVVLCDTNGGAFPDEIADGVKAAIEAVKVNVGIHCHNDCGLAAANAITAVKAGASQVQGTFIGYGERCGNTNLSTVIGDLQMKLGYSVVPPESMGALTKTARYIAEVSNIKLINSMPFVGASAFAHKGGMHADGVIKNSATFEHINPSSVGNERIFPLSEVAGRTTLVSKLENMNIGLGKESRETGEIIDKIKKLELDGYQFEAADASFELLVLRHLGMSKSYFSVDHYKIISAHSGNASDELASALIKVKVGSKYEITADEGYGPVNAIDRALRKALEVFYPSISKVRLTDYKVRVMNGAAATASVTRVLIESTDGVHSWTTVGASNDIISASIYALADSLEYKLYKYNEI